MLLLVTFTCVTLLLYFKSDFYNGLIQITLKGTENERDLTVESNVPWANKTGPLHIKKIQSNISKNEAIKDDNSFVMNEDAFTVPSNEQNLYLRSAYLDYRFNTARTWILAVVARTLDVKAAQCAYMKNKDKTEVVKAIVSMDSISFTVI